MMKRTRTGTGFTPDHEKRFGRSTRFYSTAIARDDRPSPRWPKAGGSRFIHAGGRRLAEFVRL